MTDFPITEQFARTANTAQLHKEARGTNSEWPASFVELKDEDTDTTSWVYRIDLDESEVDKAKVEAALTNHVPDPNYGKSPDKQRLLALKQKGWANLTAAERTEAQGLIFKLASF